MKKGIIFILLLIVIIQGGLLYYNEKVDQGEKTLGILIEAMDPRKDAAERIMAEVGISGLEDVYFSQNDNTITLSFGKFKFDLNKKDLITPEMRLNLEKLGLETYVNKEGNVKFKYNGEVIKEVLE